MNSENKPKKNKKVTILVVLGAIFGIVMLIFVSIAGVSATTTPMLTWGNIEIGKYPNQVPAPVGTIVEVFVGNNSMPSGSTIIIYPGRYGTIIVRADDSQYGEPLTYIVDGVVATQCGPDNGVFSLENQVVVLVVEYPLVPPKQAPALWTFSKVGFFPRHLPDFFNGQVRLDKLNNIPIEIQGVYYEDGTFWGNGAPGNTLLKLENGLIADYLVSSIGACEWEIPLN